MPTLRFPQSFARGSKEDVLKDAALQHEFFYRVFPMQVDIGKKLPSTLDWFLSRTADASKRNAPRELIHLLSVLRQEQLRRYELGNSEPPSEDLFDKTAIRSSMPEVSKVRYEQTLCAEHPDLKNYLNKLENEKTQQTTNSLAKLWQCTKGEAHQTAETLVEVGFFERKGTKESPTYWIPFLYRDALSLVQGKAV
ncbi:MAG: hypothetical protein ABIQ95_03815 [Bdellovibrionia bacterium]